MPKRSLKPSEHQIQESFIQLVCLHKHRYPALRLGFAVPNGELRNKAIAAKLKAEGVVPGPPDWMLPVPTVEYIGYAIEFKRPGQKPSAAQSRFHHLLKACYWRVEIHTDAGAAWLATKNYLGHLTSDTRLFIVQALAARDGK